VSRYRFDDLSLHPMSAAGWNPALETWFAEVWSPTTVALSDTATREGVTPLEIPTVDALLARLTERGIPMPDRTRFGLRTEEQALLESTGGYIYEGHRRDGIASVEVVGPHGARAPLTEVIKMPILAVEWGYGGGGPSDLARCLVTHRLGCPDPATARELLTDVVAGLPAGGWQLTGSQLDGRIVSLSQRWPEPESVPAFEPLGPGLGGPALGM
jgi:hypothetical protein